ncbi:MAG: cation diffusion facilitator family transporter, partial [Halanaerobiaceae bacterium]
NLVDVLATSAALIGIWRSRFIHPLFDPVAGLLVALWIFYAVGEIIWENLGYLTGRGAPQELVDKIAWIAASVNEVDDVHHLIAEYVGPQLRIDMHINLAGNLTLDQAHDIGEKVSEKIESLPEVDLAFIHIEPTERD